MSNTNIKKKKGRFMPPLTGYAKWETTGKWLHHKADKPKRDYEHQSENELKAKKTIAEKWLKENPTHKDYAKALTNYERITSELDLLSGKGLL
jgi:hypothetical protein